MTAPPQRPRARLPARVRKARRSSVVACGHYVLTGQLIVNRGSGRCCLLCALAHIRSDRTIDDAARGGVP